MGKLVDVTVRMGPHDWNRSATEAVARAVTVLNEETGQLDITGRSNRLIAAGNLLNAARAMRGHANMLEIEGGDDVSTVEAWDLSDEGGESVPAWPVVSAQLREALGDNKKTMQLVDHLDRLFALAEAKGLPVVTLAEIEQEIAEPA